MGFSYLMTQKFLFITGGVVSSLGKGLTSAAVGMLLEKKGHKVAMLKLDPYLNVDPGTMNPFQHGEVFVTDDGAETDLDLGHYHRFTNSPLSALSNVTSGQIYNQVIKQERRGEYLGKTVQVIPHITDEIKRRLLAAASQTFTSREKPDVILVEIGGTVGDIESLPFFEAIRQFKYEHPGQCAALHLTYVPFLKAAGEVKTKPTQHSVAALQRLGIVPDVILCRCENPLPDSEKDKISLFCNVKRDAVFDEEDVEHTIYEMPLMLHRQGVDAKVCELLQLEDNPVDLTDWENIVNTVCNSENTVTIGVVGKYVQHQDAYKSVFEALRHAGIANSCKVEIKRLESDGPTEDLIKEIQKCHGCLVPGGFGQRGWQGKVQTAKYCREHRIPYFGICLGMQAMAVDFAVHQAGIAEGSTTEVDPDTPHPIISLLSEQKDVVDLGGTMRLGAYPCQIQKGSKAFCSYEKELVYERHRHRYEFNNSYKEQLENAGLLFSGTLQEGQLCEICEVQDHPWMIGVQFHPEFQSKPTAAHPLFTHFIAAAIKQKA